MTAKEVKIRPYDSFKCEICGGSLSHVRHVSLKGQCYSCIDCSRTEPIKQVLTREYKQELRAVPAMHRAKVLDMMQRDIVRWFKQRNEAGIRAAITHQTRMDV